jgi:hypothetical protein
VFVLTAFQTISLQNVITDLLTKTVTRLQGVQFPGLAVSAACSNIELTWLSNEFRIVSQSTQFVFLDGTSLQVKFSISTQSAYRVNAHVCTLGVGTTCSACVPVHIIAAHVGFYSMVALNIYLVCALMQDCANPSASISGILQVTLVLDMSVVSNSTTSPAPIFLFTNVQPTFGCQGAADFLWTSGYTASFNRHGSFFAFFF